MQGLWEKTAAYGFRMTAGTPSGRYGLPLWNRDRLALYPPAACGYLSQGRGGQVPPCDEEGDLVGATTPAHCRTLPREWHSQAAAR